MREILFKAKRVDSGEWVEGYYIKARYHWHNHGKHEDWIVTGACANGGWFTIHGRHAIRPETLCQFTGIYDKNGKRIWENDIVSAEYDKAYNYIVVFKEGCFCTQGIATIFYVPFADCEFGISCGENEPCLCEVIGNRFDNPELLAEEQQNEKGGEKE